jgi:stress response protein YsnF
MSVTPATSQTRVPAGRPRSSGHSEASLQQFAQHHAEDSLVRRAANDVQVRAHTDSETTTTARTADTDIGFMDSVANFFADLFGPNQDDAGHYAEAVRRGGAVVAVTVADENRIASAREALAETGAVDIEKRVAEWRQSGYKGYRSDAAPYTSDEIAKERSRVIPVVEEEVKVGKRQVDLGAVRVVSRMVETPVNETVTLRDERADIERRPVDRTATEADLNDFREQTIEVRETSEKAVLSKVARVVEEVVVGKTASERNEQVSVSVRKTVVDVQKTGNESAGSEGVAGRMMDTTTDTAASPRTPTDYDDDFRRDWTTRYATLGGTYDDYAPAYRYGSTLGTDTHYQGRTWEDIENTARGDWQTRYPSSNWEQFKAAVRHGWERVTGQR